MRWKGPLEIDATVAENIRRYRTEAGWSQARLGEIIGVSFQQMQKYESGANRITIGRLVMICEALQVDLLEMVEKKSTRAKPRP